LSSYQKIRISNICALALGEAGLGVERAIKEWTEIEERRLWIWNKICKCI